MVAAASANAPTPGSTMASACAMSAGSSETRTSPPAAASPRSTLLRFPLR